MKENLRRQAHEWAKRFRHVLESVATPGEKITWTTANGEKSLTINQLLDGFELEQLRALDHVIRMEHSDSEPLMRFAAKELRDYLYVARQMQEEKT